MPFKKHTPNVKNKHITLKYLQGAVILLAPTLRRGSLSWDALRSFAAGAVELRSHAGSVGTINVGNSSSPIKSPPHRNTDDIAPLPDLLVV